MVRDEVGIGNDMAPFGAAVLREWEVLEKSRFKYPTKATDVDGED